ncbi:MAG: hypothetical protein V3W50_06095, partial [Thermoanaerobaculia bacterium]
PQATPQQPSVGPQQSHETGDQEDGPEEGNGGIDHELHRISLRIAGVTYPFMTPKVTFRVPKIRGFVKTLSK